MEALARAMFLGLCGMLVADLFISVMYSKLLWVLLALGPAMYAIARREDAAEPVRPESAQPALSAAPGY